MLQVACLKFLYNLQIPAAKYAITGTFGQDRTELNNPHALLRIHITGVGNTSRAKAACWKL